VIVEPVHRDPSGEHIFFRDISKIKLGWDLIDRSNSVPHQQMRAPMISDEVLIVFSVCNLHIVVYNEQGE
jgi:hypothetical protein